MQTIAQYLRPGFPKETLDEGSYRNVFEYVGPSEELDNIVEIGMKWGSYPGLVVYGAAEPIDKTEYSILTVIVERKFDSADYDSAKQETNFEIDWVSIQRPLIEHPKFRVGGGGTYQLTETDIIELRAWEDGTDTEKKAEYKFKPKYELSDYYQDLSTNAKMYAKGVVLGIEYFNDKAPVARRTEAYAGGPPPESNAGQKETPANFPGLPSGYEWIREADRGLRRGGQTRWNRDIEWLGAKKVLVDRDEVFWTAPS